MAQTNPWKLAMINRGSTSRVANGPVQQQKQPQNPWKAQQNNNTNQSPPWMKKKQDNTNTGTQPPWAKQANQQPNNNQPAWMKKNTDNNQTNNQPAWMKKKDETNQSNNQPSWMKKNNQSSSSSNISAWKAGGNASKFQTPQQKRQRQQKEKAQQLKREQQLRLQKEKQQAQIKEKQLQKQQRQRKMMYIQDKISVQRQKQEKQKQKPLEKNKKASPNKGSKLKLKKNNSPKQISKFSQDNHFLNFVNYLQQSTCKNDYQTKLQYQKQLLNCLKKFSQDCQSKIKQFLQTKKLSSKKRCYINFQDLQVRYALGQSTHIEGKSMFDISCIESLRNQFSFYQKLQSIIISLMKKNNTFKIRIPLLCFITYKGIDFLCQGQFDELLQVIPAQASSFNEIASQLIQIEKQLKDANLNLDKNDFIVKKIHIDSQQLFILYAKESSLKQNKNKPLAIENFTNLEQFDKPYLNFISDQQLKMFSNTISQNMKKIINTFRQAQYINKIYLCAQGELDEQIFWRMILQGKTQILNMIQQCGYDSQPIKNGLLLKIYQCLSSIKFNFHPDVLTGKKDIIKTNNPKIMNLKFQNLELVQICSYFDKYLIQNRIQLAKEALKLKKEIFQICEEQKYSQQGIAIMRNQATILFNTKQFQKAEQILKEIQENTPMFGFQKIHIYNLLISVYIIRDNETEVLQTFSKLLNILDFYFGNDTFVHSTIYSILGHYYSKIPERQKQAEKFFELSLSIAFKIYGAKNPLLADVYLGRAQHFLLRQMFERCEKDLKQALTIYKSTSKNGSRIADSLFLTAKLHLAQKNIEKSIQTFKMAQTFYLKLNHSVEAIEICFILLQIAKEEQQKDKILQEICSISLKYKNHKALKKITSQIFDKQLKTYPKVRGSVFTDLFDEQNEESIYNARSFGSFTQMIKWSVNVICLRSQSADFDRAAQIIESVLKIYKNKEQLEEIFGF